jgi:broad specificity phosphatase PhoE
MKWPSELLLVRHAPSAYNQLRHKMGRDTTYRQFVAAFNNDPLSDKTIELAKKVHQKFPTVEDIDTPLSDGAIAHAKDLGVWLRQNQNLPDVVYVSPYVRTWATLTGIFDGWPELADVRLIEEERIREQEFGLRLLYSDWRLFLCLHPDQLALHDMQGFYWYRYPQGENIPDVRARNRSWMTTLTRDFAGKRILAITHHLNILAFRANMERLSAAQFTELDAHHKPGNCSVTIYRGYPYEGRDGRLRLESYDLQPVKTK